MSTTNVKLFKRIRALTKAIVEEASSNSEFAKRLGEAIGPDADTASQPLRKRHRRQPAVLDPFIQYEKGDQELRQSLERLGLENLKDIIAAYGMDRAKLAMNWKTKQRLVDLILATVKARSHKGEVFRG